MHIISNMDANNKRRRIMASILFVIYFIILFYFLFFSEKLGRTPSERAYHYNLVPFKEIHRFLTYRKVLGMKAVMLNIVGNIAAFVPIGIFLPICSAYSKRLWRTVLYSFELSFLVEVLQLVFRVGSFDVDDLILNTVGGLLGFFLYFLGKHIVRGGGRGEKTT